MVCVCLWQLVNRSKFLQLSHLYDVHVLHIFFLQIDEVYKNSGYGETYLGYSEITCKPVSDEKYDVSADVDFKPPTNGGPSDANVVANIFNSYDQKPPIDTFSIEENATAVKGNNLRWVTTKKPGFYFLFPFHRL